MNVSEREIVIQKLTEMSADQVLKVLIFMAGMEAENATRRPEPAVKKKRNESAS